MLQSRLSLCYFLVFLLHEQCAENLFFYLEVDAFRQTAASPNARLERAVKIVETFIADGSALEINIDEEHKKHILYSIAHDTNVESLFDQAQTQIFSMLAGTYAKWTCSTTFHTLIADLPAGCRRYSREMRRIAASRILEYFDSLFNHSVLPSSFASKTKMFYWLCNVFCKNRLGLEFVTLETHQEKSQLECKQP